MKEIIIGDYVITSTNRCFIFGEYKYKKNPDTGKRERFLDPIGYYPRLEALLDQFPQRVLMRSNAGSIQELIDLFRKYTKDIYAALKVNP